MRKLPDWVQKFQGVIEGAGDKPFDWQTHNCCTFAAECFEAITGQQAMPKLKYKTKKQAQATLLKLGGITGIMEGVANKYGLMECHPNMAKRGDPVIIEIGGGELFGTIDLSGQLVLALPVDGTGVIRVQLDLVKRAWNIS